MIKSLCALAATVAIGALATAAEAQPQIRLEPLAEGLNAPLAMVETPDGRFLVIEQWGRVMVVEDGQLGGVPFLDIRNLIVDQFPDFDERGQIGRAHV